VRQLERPIDGGVLSVLEGYRGGDKPASVASIFFLFLWMIEIAGSSKGKDRVRLLGTLPVSRIGSHLPA
jgi:hypothetical protein